MPRIALAGVLPPAVSTISMDSYIFVKCEADFSQMCKGFGGDTDASAGKILPVLLSG